MTVLRGLNVHSIEDAVLRIRSAAKARVPEFSGGGYWSLCELGLDEDDYHTLARWLGSLRRRTVEAYTESSALLLDEHGRMVPVTHDDAGVTRSAALGLLALALACEHHHREAARSVWKALEPLHPSDNGAASLLFASNAQPTSALKDAILQASAQLHVRNFFDESDRQRWYDSVMVQGPFPGLGEISHLASWLDGLPTPVWVARLRDHSTQSCETFKQLWAILQSFRRNQLPLSRCLVAIEDPSLARWLPRTPIEPWLRALDAEPRRAAYVNVVGDGWNHPAVVAITTERESYDEDSREIGIDQLELRLRWPQHHSPSLTVIAPVPVPRDVRVEAQYEHDVEVLVDSVSVGWMTLESTEGQNARFHYVFTDGSREIPLPLRATSVLTISDTAGQSRLLVTIETLPSAGPSLRAFAENGRPCEIDSKDARLFLAPEDAVATPTELRRCSVDGLVLLDLPIDDGRTIVSGERLLLGTTTAPRPGRAPSMPHVEPSGPPTLSLRIGDTWRVVDPDRDAVDRDELERTLTRITGTPRWLDERATLWAGIHPLGPARRGLRTMPNAPGYGEDLVVRCESEEPPREFVIARAITAKGALRDVHVEASRALRLSLVRKLRVEGIRALVIDHAGMLHDYKCHDDVVAGENDGRVDQLVVPLDVARPRIVALIDRDRVLGTWTAPDWCKDLLDSHDRHELLLAARALHLPILAPEAREEWRALARAHGARTLETWLPVPALSEAPRWRGIPLPRDGRWLEVLRQILPSECLPDDIEPAELRRMIGLQVFPEGFSRASAYTNSEACAALIQVEKSWGRTAARRIKEHPSGDKAIVRRMAHRVLRVPFVGDVPKQDKTLRPLLAAARAYAASKIGDRELAAWERDSRSDRHALSQLRSTPVNEWLFLHSTFELATEVARGRTAR